MNNPSSVRRLSRIIMLGNLPVGGGAPISVQSMTNTKTADITATVRQINQLKAAGCEAVRLAVPDEAAAKALGIIKTQVNIPLVADIHFDYRLAVMAAKNGADGLRINPGNIGGRDKAAAVVAAAQTHGLPIRIGVNAGSLDKAFLENGRATPRGMADSALSQAEQLCALGFESIKLSLKASDVNRTVEAYRLVADACDFPLHLGITEAGSLFDGLVKSSLGIGMLLAEGLGDTIRVSLTADPVAEIRAGYSILRALDLRRRGVEIISCPTCGRCDIDLIGLAKAAEAALSHVTAPLKVAIMGCVVNGPGEAKEADIGIAGGKDLGIIFKRGEFFKKVPQENLLAELLTEIAKMTPDGTNSSLPESLPPQKQPH